MKTKHNGFQTGLLIAMMLALNPIAHASEMSDQEHGLTNSPIPWDRMGIQAGVDRPPPNPCDLITNLSGFSQMAVSAPDRTITLNLEATVWWSDPSVGRVILHDPSSTEQVELDLPCQIPAAGMKLRLTGRAMVSRVDDILKLDAVPLVDDDGLHEATETKSGRIHLTAGFHSLRVDWFNRTDKYALKVSYAGSNLALQPIPASALLHAEPAGTGDATRLASGLDFRCCEGTWWSRLPNLSHLPAVRTGVADNFDLDLASRREHVGMQFTGFIKIPGEGDYTFDLASDDGSRLFLGEPSLRVETPGPGASPALESLPATLPPDHAGSYFWSEMAGTVISVNRLRENSEIELLTAYGSVRLLVAEPAENSAVPGLHQPIRAAGVCRYALNLNGQMTPAEFFVQSWKDLAPGRVPAELAPLSGDKNSKGQPILTEVEQVNSLSRDELTKSHPVRLRGVVTCVLQGDAAVLQDATLGIYLAIGKPVPLHVGDYCEVEGVTAPGQFSPYIAVSKIEKLGNGSLPEPVHPSWDQLLNGSMHCQYVELEGIATSVESNNVILFTRGGRIRVQLDAMGLPFPKSCENALVQLRGCLFADWDKQAQRVEVGNIRLMQTWLNVMRPAPADLFALPGKRVQELLQFDPRAGALQPVKVSGQIIFQEDGDGFLMDGANGMRFIYAKEPNGRVCDRVEVVGFPDFSGPSPTLREAVVRRLGPAALPPPHRLDPEALLRDEYDSTLVQLDGVLQGTLDTPDGLVLDLQNGWQRFTATLKEVKTLKEHLTTGSKLELTGTYVGQGGNRVLGRPIDSFILKLNSGFDIRVLSRPPWWNLPRLLAVLGVLVGVLAAAAVWIKLLQRQVAERSRHLEIQIQQRQQAEQQRVVEQERARVAHDLHDELGAGLTRVNMLTTLAANPGTTEAEKAQYLADLNGMARDMVTSLDEIVWAVNPRNDTLASLVGYFCAHAQRLLALASVKCGLDIAENLPDHPLDSKFRHEMLMAFLEAITNVVRHAAAKKVLLRIAVRENTLRIEVADDGCGLEAGGTESGSDGLANMRERLSALGGRCDIRANPGGGTTVAFEAPIVTTKP